MEFASAQRRTKGCVRMYNQDKPSDGTAIHHPRTAGLLHATFAGDRPD